MLWSGTHLYFLTDLMFHAKSASTILTNSDTNDDDKILLLLSEILLTYSVHIQHKALDKSNITPTVSLCLHSTSFIYSSHSIK